MTSRTNLLFSFLFILFSACSAFKKAPDSPAASDSGLRYDLVQEARQQLGKPYKYAGKSPRTGFDCSGLIYYVMGRHNIAVSPASKVLAKEGRGVRLQEVLPGDIIYYKRSAVGPVFHVSLVVSNDRSGITVIHSVSRGVVEENITQSSYWNPKIAGARRLISR